MHGVIDTRPAGECRARLLLAHGAGAPMDSDFMNAISDLLAGQGIAVRRFEFPYMQKRREDGRKRPPDRAPALLAAFAGQLAGLPDDVPVLVGGKSMGGRMASMLAVDHPVAGVACLGYPFHPPGKPEKLRIAHFADIQAPVLICQGERDSFGTRAEVEAMTLPPQVHVAWLEDGNHDLKPRKASGLSHEDNLQACAAAVGAFVAGL
ncbi:MAG: dienelactone hydrolase family protein [Alcanivoracaceae bacterium]|nr:dienelactone hydrolase family protein [Alcanivoracaceae bacterium]